MALFSLSVKSMNRKSGKSAVAAAAYRSCSMLHDERTGDTYDFRRKQSVTDPANSFIVTPDQAPAWAYDRTALWNAAEAAENRGNSTTAREWLIALPAELGDDQRRDLARQFSTALAERFDIAADISIHAPGKDDDYRNHHAHILTTSRKLGPGGLGAKTRELDVKTTASAAIEEMRKMWAEMVNSALEQQGRPERVDHRSYERQGVETLPGIHLGAKATVAKRAKLSHPRLDRAQAIADANAAKRQRAHIRSSVNITPARPDVRPRRSRQAAIQAAHQRQVVRDSFFPAPIPDTRPRQSRRAAIEAARLRRLARDSFDVLAPDVRPVAVSRRAAAKIEAERTAAAAKRATLAAAKRAEAEQIASARQMAEVRRLVALVPRKPAGLNLAAIRDMAATTARQISKPPTSAKQPETANDYADLLKKAVGAKTYEYEITFGQAQSNGSFRHTLARLYDFPKQAGRSPCPGIYQTKTGWRFDFITMTIDIFLNKSREFMMEIINSFSSLAKTLTNGLVEAKKSPLTREAEPNPLTPQRQPEVKHPQRGPKKGHGIDL